MHTHTHAPHPARAHTQVVGNSVSKGTKAVCSSWGDPQITSWSQSSYTFSPQGSYILARDAKGDLSVSQYVVQCGVGAPATATCARRVFVYHKCPTCVVGSFYHMWLNQTATPEGLADTTLYVSKVAGDTLDGIAVTQDSTDSITFTIPGGLEVAVKVEVARDWLVCRVFPSIIGWRCCLCGSLFCEVAVKVEVARDWLVRILFLYHQWLACWLCGSFWCEVAIKVEVARDWLVSNIFL